MGADGFMTKEEWVDKGRKEEDWRSEEEFEKRGKEILPIVNANNKKLTEKVEALQSDIAKIAEFNEKQAEKLRQEGYDKALKELEGKMDAAIDDGDKTAVKAITKERDKIVTEKNKVQAVVPKEDPVFNEWKEKNKWYEEDPELKAWADDVGGDILEAQIAKKGKDRKSALDFVAQEVKARFREKFENENRNKAAAVEGEGAKGKKGNGKGWDDLPDSAKKQYSRIAEQMELKGRKYKKEDYVANYEF